VVDWQFYIRLHSNRTEANIWSDLGMGAVAQWKAFDHYLTEVARGRSVLPGPSELELCLPYAAAFGVLPPLLKRQEKRDGYAQPAWFQAIPTADSSDSTSIMAFLYSCETTASSDGGTGGPAGGASGGGASDAG
jgi:uncharacterized membrane protein